MPVLISHLTQAHEEARAQAMLAVLKVMDAKSEWTGRCYGSDPSYVEILFMQAEVFYKRSSLEKGNFFVDTL